MIYIVIAIIVILILLIVLYAVMLSSAKARNKKIGEYADVIAVQLKEQGVNASYEMLDDTELLSLYNELLQIPTNLKSDKALKEFADKGCRAKFIEDILAKRGIQIPKNNNG